MPGIKPSCLRDLKLRVNLADVVSRVVTLRKAGGSRLKGLCPFHNEKTPSFNVDADKGYYKCFGCGKAGDAISFVRESEQLNFTEAVEALGKRFGIVIEYDEGSGGPTTEERSLRQEIFDLHEIAADHFHQAFKAKDPNGEFFRNYWTEKRRFGMEIADEFKIGAADAQGSGLGGALMRRKFSEEALRRCGLFFIYDNAAITLGALRSRFRGRLMIPIRDHQGRVVAFTARQTELTPADDPAREAKYVNSPETPIFTKGNLLFNLDRARSEVGKLSPFYSTPKVSWETRQQLPWSFIMVEGQLDAIRCWSVGLKTAIAPQGTSITEGQLRLLARYHNQIECFFDSDSAGHKAALRLLPMAFAAGLEVRFLTSSGEGKLDPDVLLFEAGFDGYRRIRESSAQDAITFLCRGELPNPSSASSGEKARAAKTVAQIISKAESQVLRFAYQKEASLQLQVGVSAFEQDTRMSDGIGNPSQVNRTVVSGLSSPEHHLLMLILHFETLGKPLSHALPHAWIDRDHPAGALLNRFLGEFEQDAWPGRDHLDSLLENAEERTLVATLLFETPVIEDPSKVAQEGLRQLRARALEPRLRQIELALANPHADSESDPISLLKERDKIQRQLRTPLVLAAAV